MAVKLNDESFDHAKELIQKGRYVFDDRDAWSEHQPTPAEENAYIEKHGWRAYSRWYLGVDGEKRPNTKGHYKFPYGDFSKVHRCAVLSAESRAGQRGYTDIEMAVSHLHGLLEAST
jgi:hypothetical protein